MADDYSPECMALVMALRLRASDVRETLADVFVIHGALSYLCRTTAQSARRASCASGCRRSVRTRCLLNRVVRRRTGYEESFSGKLRNELLAGEILDTLTEPKILIAVVVCR